MVESNTAPKKHLALDTDWTSACGMGLLFLLCCLVVAVRTRSILHETVSVEPITWQTWFVLGMAAWFFFGVRPGEYRKAIWFVMILLAIDPASRIALRTSHASLDTQLANAAFLRVINDLIFVGGCVFVVWWFKSKIRRVA